MSNRLSPLSASVLCSASLLVAAPPAQACSPTRALDLEVIASSRGGGPIVLLVQCFDGERCPALSTLRLERDHPGGALAGTVEVKAMPDSSTNQLVFFRPAQPFDAVGNSTLIASFDNYGSIRISLPLHGTADPFEGMTSRIWERSESVGEHYSCGKPPSGCEPSDWLDWEERLLVHPILDVWMPPNDGWLFRTVSGLYAGGPWARGTVAAADLSPDAESCVVLETWNPSTDARETRRVCGPRWNVPPSHVTTPIPSLGRCSEPPVRADGEEASELFEKYCLDRAAFCSDPTSRQAVCAIDPRCALQVPDAAVTVDVGHAPDAATLDADGGAQAASMRVAAGEGNAMSDPEQADGDGCALGRRGGQAWGFALALTALARRRKRAAT